MTDLELLLERYRLQLGISEEEEQRIIEECRANNPVSLLENKVNVEFSNLDDRTQGMQDIDTFTLDKTFQLDDRTEGMKEIDDFTLAMVFELLARVEMLELELKGGN